jgi:hypothetical protein
MPDIETRAMSSVDVSPDVSPGDTIEVAVTHQVTIGRENAWVKAGVVTKVRQDESGVEAGERATRYVNTQVINSIMQAVETVTDFEKGRKS